MQLRDELDHLFFFQDYLDFITGESQMSKSLVELYGEIAEGKVLNYSLNGAVGDQTYLASKGKEFVISGMSFVRHGHYLNWCLLGGMILSQDEWNDLGTRDFSAPADIPAPKKLFLQEMMAESGDRLGMPLKLEGTERAVRTVLCCEIDLESELMQGRCLLTEFENSFDVQCDDPELLDYISRRQGTSDTAERTMERMAESAPLWSMASALLWLPLYFDTRVPLERSATKGALRQPSGRSASTGAVHAIRYVSSIDYRPKDDPPPLRSYMPREFRVDPNGYWRRLETGKFGFGPAGEQVAGRTWIKASNPWRERSVSAKTIYVKSTLAAAKAVASTLTADKHLDDVSAAAEGPCL